MLVIPIIAVVRIADPNVETRRNRRNLQKSANVARISDRVQFFIDFRINRKRSLRVGNFNVDGSAIVEKEKVKTHWHCPWE
jgi:hypothetical protein